jgi:hypothetical protein
MPEWPKPYHPARYEGLDYVVDPTTTADGYQVRPDTRVDCARWCGGNIGLTTNGLQVVYVGGQVAHLGDFIMNTGDGVFHVEPGDGHYQRWSPA